MLRGRDVVDLLASYPSESFPFENIAFEGGGIKGLAHVGGLRVSSACSMVNNVVSILLNIEASQCVHSFSMYYFHFLVIFIHFSLRKKYPNVTNDYIQLITEQFSQAGILLMVASVESCLIRI